MSASPQVRRDAARARLGARAARLLLLLCAAGGLWGLGAAGGLCAPAWADEWGQQGGSSDRRGRSGERVGPGSAPAWSAAAGRCTAGVVIADGYLVQVEAGGRVRACAAATGTPAWTRDLGARDVQATPAAGRGRVVIALGDGRVVCLALASGELLWSTAAGGGPRAALALSEGQVVVSQGFPSRALRSLSLETGAALWAVELGQVGYSTPAIGAGLVVVGTNSGRFEARRLSDGAPAWTFDTGGRVLLAGAALDGSHAYLAPGGADARLYGVALDRSQASQDWSVALPDPIAPSWPGWALMGVQRATSTPSLTATSGGTYVVVILRFDYTLDTKAPWYVADTYVSRERVFVVDPRGPSIVWQAALGSQTSGEADAVPAFGRCPEALSFNDGASEWLALSSSLGATLGFYRAQDGVTQGGFSLAGQRWASAAAPALANAQLALVAESGALQVVGLGGNLAPSAPRNAIPAGAVFAELRRPTLAWSAAQDADDAASTLQYEVRLDCDGELLLDAELQTLTAAGATEWQVPVDLRSDERYTYAVRARDPKGAWSGWSQPSELQLAITPEPPRALVATSRESSIQLAWEPSLSPQVETYLLRWGLEDQPLGEPEVLGRVLQRTLGGLRRGRRYRFELSARSYLGKESRRLSLSAAPEAQVRLQGRVMSSLAQALASARPGETVSLGAGVFAVQATLFVPAGVRLEGAGAHVTRFVGGDPLGTVVRLGQPGGEAGQAGQAGQPATLAGVAVTGGRNAVEVWPGGARLEHVLIYGAPRGLIVHPDASLEAEFLTLAECPDRGLWLEGSLRLVNSLVSGCGIGVEVLGAGSLGLSYSALVGNHTEQVGAQLPLSLAAPPRFLAPQEGDFRVRSDSPSVDQGDPEAPLGAEQEPHGGRVNLGAFGGTQEAARTPPPPAPVPRSERACSLGRPGPTPTALPFCALWVLALGLGLTRVLACAGASAGARACAVLVAFAHQLAAWCSIRRTGCSLGGTVPRD